MKLLKIQKMHFLVGFFIHISPHLWKFVICSIWMCFAVATEGILLEDLRKFVEKPVSRVWKDPACGNGTFMENRSFLGWKDNFVEKNRFTASSKFFGGFLAERLLKKRVSSPSIIQKLCICRKPSFFHPTSSGSFPQTLSQSTPSSSSHENSGNSPSSPQPRWVDYLKTLDEDPYYDDSAFSGKATVKKVVPRPQIDAEILKKFNLHEGDFWIKDVKNITSEEVAQLRAAWPIPEILPSKASVIPVKLDTQVDGYDFVATFYDPERDYTWCYRRYNPLKVGKQSPVAERTWEGATLKDQRYYSTSVAPPEKLADSGIFRQAPLENLLVEDMNGNPPGDKQWNYIPSYPFGLNADYQNFYQTVAVKKNAGRNPSIKWRKLGKSELQVSEVCLGCMTFGLQVNETVAHELLDYAFDEFNVNFFDTAELYPLPALPSNYGNSERILGKWIASRSEEDREKMVVATKIAGYSEDLGWLRNGSDSRGTSLTKEQILKATDASLRRLKLKHIDLLQFHWPERYVPLHDSGDYSDMLYDVARAKSEDRASKDSIEEQVEAIGELFRMGKIKAWGLSNETPWGVLRFQEIAEQKGIPGPASVQLNYNLLCRNDVEKGFVEICRPQNLGIALLAYGPLAGGILSGKYLEFLEYPTTGRMLRFPSYMKRLRGSIASRAIREYHEMAMRGKLPNMAVISLRWVYTRPFICSTVIGATDKLQLQENLWCLNEALPMSDVMEREINTLHWKWRDPIRIIQ